MTGNPQRPTHLLTIAEYSALGRPLSGYTELRGGQLLLSQSPTPEHMIASGELFVQIRQQLPANLRVIQDVDINLELLPPGGPGASRRPDLIVVDEAVLKRSRAERTMIRASDVLLVIEIVSPGSRRTDNVFKRAEYADAGIPHYWIIDIEEPVTLVDCRLTEEFGYRDDGTATGVFAASVPFPITVDLNQLF